MVIILFNLDGNKHTYWASNPGTSSATFTLTFSEYITSSQFTINWKYIAKEFELYSMTLEKGWKKITIVKNNRAKKNTFNLNLTNVRSIRIKMLVPLESFMNQGIYGINKLKLIDGGVPIVREKCENIKNELKTWIVDEQWFYVVSKKLDYVRAYNNL